MGSQGEGPIIQDDDGLPKAARKAAQDKQSKAFNTLLDRAETVANNNPGVNVFVFCLSKFSDNDNSGGFGPVAGKKTVMKELKAGCRAVLARHDARIAVPGEEETQGGMKLLEWGLSKGFFAQLQLDALSKQLQGEYARTAAGCRGRRAAVAAAAAALGCCATARASPGNRCLAPANTWHSLTSGVICAEEEEKKGRRQKKKEKASGGM
jgi:hypothetical protein